MPAALPKVPSSGGIQEIATLFSSVAPMFGSGKTTATQQSSVDPTSLGQADQLLAQILSQSENGNIDAMISDILQRAKQEFGSFAISSNAAGIRGYSDTVRQQMANESMARATAAAAKAKLDFQNAQNRVASDLVQSRMANTRSVKSQQKTGASPMGKATGLILGGAQIYNKLFKKKPPIAKVPGGGSEIASGDYAAGITSDFDSGFAAAQEAGVDMSAFGPGVGGADASIASLTDLGLEQQSTLLESSAPLDTFTTSAFSEGAIDVTGDAGASLASGLETGATTGVVTSNFAMPPAIPAVPPMPPAIPGAGVDPFMFEEAAEAADVATGVEIGADVGANVAIDYAAGEVAASGIDFGADALAEGGANILGFLGDLYFPGMFTIVNELTGGAVTDAVVEIDDKLFEGDFTKAVGQAGEFIDDAVHDIADELTDFDDNVLQPIGDLVDDFIGGACFITTAATKNGELDNGVTLQTLRQFRSSFMQETPERQSELVDYYLLAPIIVRRIDKFDNSDDLYTEIRKRFLEPAVSYYNAGLPEETYRIYKSMMYWTRQQVGLANA